MNIPADDRGFLLGDGLFETVLWDEGLVLWEAHLRRLLGGCEALGLPAADSATLETAAREALTRAGVEGARAAVRLTWSAGSGGRGLERPPVPAPRLAVTAAPAPLPDGPASLQPASVRRNTASPTSRLKTLSYLDNVAARREAVAAGSDEALMLNEKGEVACAAAANVFWLHGKTLFTPALSCGALDGVARGRVLALAAKLGWRTQEVEAPLSAVREAEALFLTNSLIGVRPAHLAGRAAPPHAGVQQLLQVTLEDFRGRRY